MDTTSNQLNGPNFYSSSLPPPLWDVFLSFCGKDTRRNFIANLYFALDQAGIQTFRDEPALEKGEEISSGLLKGIRKSKMFVVVISENYARSPWCLDELVEIFRCKSTKNQVIPVFYYVDPSDLRYQKGSFGEALDFHKKRYSVDMIEKWKYALVEIAKLSGYHLRKDAYVNESDTIQNIVKNVAPQASTNVLYLEEYLLGIDSAVEEIYQKLSMEADDVRAIGICGMGGIGKTTTAKAFYNKYSNKFDIRCFIDNVRQFSQGADRLLPLINQLLVEFLKRKDYKVPDVESGIRQLKQILFSKRALIILDDLDRSSHSKLLTRLLKFFFPGSRIIITTRDTNLLNQLKEDVSEVDYYMVKKLGIFESLELFSYHAFRKSEPPETFRELSISFATYAGGHPLALKVLGSSLRGRTQVSFWKAKLEKVLKIPENEIQKLLQLSYEELSDETEKAIFLDIVFFFIGKNMKDAIHIFKSCDFFPEVGIPILIDKCLLTINEHNEFQMHNLIEDMGREVSREQTRHGICRRLYLHGRNACHALKHLEKTEKVEVLVIDLTVAAQREMTTSMFERLPNLRLLEIIQAHDIVGNFENSFFELRCIRWSHCPWTHLPSTFYPEKLISFDMPFNQFKTIWKNAKPLGSLKTIDLSYSKNLKDTYGFRDMKFVERLLLRGCEELREVHSSIGQLTSLGYLDLAECHQLENLPESIGQLDDLGHLNLHDCYSLVRLPEPVKQLTNLTHLIAGGCRNLERLPEQLGDMFGLRNLDVSDTAIVQLPDSLGELSNLVELNLCDCPNLTSLPESICKLKFLRELLLVSSPKLDRLPEQFGNMQSLEVLCASETAIEVLPESIGLLSSLRYLNFNGCDRLEYVPSSIGNLTSLTFLGFPDSLINVPDSVQNLEKLETLYMQCDTNLWLPVILRFSYLTSLNLTHTGRTSSSTGPFSDFSLSKLSNLLYLQLSNFTGLGSSLIELPLKLRELSVSNHSTLEQLQDLSRFKQMYSFRISGCIGLQSIQSLPPHLQYFSVHECTSLKELPDLSMLKELKDFSVTGCINLKLISLGENSLQVGRDVFCIQNMDLRTISLVPEHTTQIGEEVAYSDGHKMRCSSLQSISLLPPLLRTLSVEECTSLQDLPDLSLLKKLVNLRFIWCNNLKSISLKQSILQGRPSCLPFYAYLPNREVAVWFDFKSSGHAVSFDIPPCSGSNLLGLALWLVFTCKPSHLDYPYMRAVITNITEGTTENYPIFLEHLVVGETQSRIECITPDKISIRSGDKIKVSIRSKTYLDHEFKKRIREVKINMFGVHLVQDGP